MLGTVVAKLGALVRGWPRVLLCLFCAFLFVMAVTRSGSAFESVDVRTYGEMMRGIWLHGVPYLENGPVGRFRPLEVPWNIVHEGRLWGTYPPLYPYLAAPLLFGGLRLVYIATFALLVPLAIVTFTLARRVLEDEWYALLAAVACVAATPILGKALEITAYPLAILLTTSGALASLVAIGEQGRRRRAFAALAGALFALASNAHLLCFPLGAASLGVLAVGNTVSPREDGGPPWLSRTPFRGLWPTRETLTSAAVAALVMGASFVPVAFLNRLRFGSYNPLSYGPTPWPGSEWGFADQSIGKHLRYAAPCLAIVATVAVAWIVAGMLRRHSRLLRVAVLAAAAGLFASVPELREHGFRLARMATLFTIDASLFDLEPPYHRVPIPGAFGNVVGPWVLKAALQSTPVLALVFVLPRMTLLQKHKMLTVLLPAAALFFYLPLRGNLPITPALGWAWVYMRYTLPGLPLLLVAALAVVREVRPGRWAWAASLLLGLAVFLFLQRRLGDDGAEAAARHVVLLAAPLALALVGIVSVVLHRRGLLRREVAAAALAALVGLSFAIGIGHDYPSHPSRRAFSEHKLASVRGVFPQRFAMIGLHWMMDQMLGLRLERDIEVGDLAQVQGDIRNARPLLDYWLAEGRPIFYIAGDEAPTPPASPWPDLEYRLVDAENRVFLVAARPASASAP